MGPRPGRGNEVEAVLTTAVSRSRGMSSVLPTEQFADRLQQERARSDRTARRFCLVVFRTNGLTGHARLRLGDQLARQVRLTDAVGWDGEQNLCAVLTETEPTGAMVLAQRVCDELADDGLQLDPVIRAYPPDRRSDDRDDFPPSNGSPEKSSEPSESISSVTSIEAKPRSRRPDPAEVMFVRPLPRWKRLVDLVGASVGLALAMPILLLAAAAIRLDSRGQVLFRQERAGLGGRPFWMYKFRTMVDGAEKQRDMLVPRNEQDGPAFKMTHDPRVTRVGRWFRKTSIDELPQLWNVLKGDMTLVGPRPLPCVESDACQQWHRARLDVTPGLTCIWQVNGRSNTNFDRWVRMDLEYARRRSLWMDLKLIAMTVPAVLLQRGAK